MKDRVQIVATICKLGMRRWRTFAKTVNGFGRGGRYDERLSSRWARWAVLPSAERPRWKTRVDGRQHREVVGMTDLPFTPTDTRDCPHCGSEGERTAILGPADCYRCQDTDCPVRGFWSVAELPGVDE